MAIGFSILITVAQILLYLMVDRFKLNDLKMIVLFLILIGNFAYFPVHFQPQIPKIDGREIRCGLPVMAAFSYFWFIGNFVNT